VNYFDEIINCPACNKPWVRREWPNVPSTGKPKRACCEQRGKNRHSVLEKRKVIVGGNTHYRCNSCNEIKPPLEFYHSKGKPNSVCKPCKKKVIYKTPSAIKRARDGEQKRLARDSQIMSCPKCGTQKKRTDWPRVNKGTGLAKTCCNIANRELLADLRSKGKSKCSVCEGIKDLSEFSTRKTGKPMSQCKECCKAKSVSTASREKRQNLIKTTDDGTITKKEIIRLFGNAKNCPVCNALMKRNDKQLDHIDPLSRSGKHSIKNVIVICSSCNNRKRSAQFEDWFSGLSDEQAKRYYDFIKQDVNLSEIAKRSVECRQQVA
jgi:5-methylcytosine-specific restriction endonuclease McrA